MKSTVSRNYLSTVTLLTLALASSCNTGTSTGSSSEAPAGTLLEKPGQAGSFYLAAIHEGGKASRVHLTSVAWARLVDIHGLEPDGSVSATPIFRDFAISPGLTSDGIDFILDTNSFTAQTKLVILRELGAPSAGNGTFRDLLAEAVRNVGPVSAMGLSGSLGSPPTLVARNSALVLTFDDLLADNDTAKRNIYQFVQTVDGYPADSPFDARVLFDPNYGGVASGSFHSNRILVDFTISALEAARLQTALAENLIGLTASLVGNLGANIALRLPTVEDASIGQFEILRNLGGSPLATTLNGPIDFSSATLDLVRAMRSGNNEDEARGFLVDRAAPQLISNWPLAVTRVLPNPQGIQGTDFLCTVTFSSTCRRAPALGDLLLVNSRILEVTRPGLAPTSAGVVTDIRVRVADGSSVSGTGQLLGLGNYQTAYDGAGTPAAGCWVTFEPPARVFPATGISPDARILLNFSEAMDPGSLRPFDSMRVFEGTIAQGPSAETSVVASITSASNLLTHAFTPTNPLRHLAGARETYTLTLSGATDLGGNALVTGLPSIEFTIDPASPEIRSGGLVLRFADPNEYSLNDPSANGNPDFRGQMNYDIVRESVLPRPVIRSTSTIDQSTPVGSLMFVLPVGVPEPLSPLGSKVSTLWRNADLGWLVTDESKDNIDVEGMAWAPFGGFVQADFFEGFEMRLAHSTRLPDEALNGAVLYAPASGFLDAPSSFDDNILASPVSPKKAVHTRGLGYRINPSDAFVVPSGTKMMPFPLNRSGGAKTTYTWRDTAVQAVGGASSGGVPQYGELEAGMYAGLNAGQIYSAGAVPSVGLPLLMELACYPSSTGVGTNGFAIGIGRLGQLFPSFRAHSTGGHNGARMITKDPDSENIPSGGFDPTSTPPGQATRSADPALYFGQLDTVVRISRVHSVWFDAQGTNPDWLGLTVEPAPADQPSGTQVRFDFRGATGFAVQQGQPFDATKLDVYGDLRPGQVSFLGGVRSWTSNLDDVDGARYVQVRITFVNNIESGLSPTLDTLALSYLQR